MGPKIGSGGAALDQNLGPGNEVAPKKAFYLECFMLHQMSFFRNSKSLQKSLYSNKTINPVLIHFGGFYDRKSSKTAASDLL